MEQVEVVWNGVPETEQRPKLESPPTAGYAGRLSREKGVDVLINAFQRVVAQLPDARLLILGDGPERKELEKLAAKLALGSNVQFQGHVSQSEVERQLEHAWVHVVPSRLMEPFGIAAIEAMMRGTAVVASDAGGLAEIVDHDRTGLLVPLADEEGMAAALVRVLADCPLAEEMGQAGRERALAQFSLSSCTEKFIQLYKSILDSQ